MTLRATARLVPVLAAAVLAAGLARAEVELPPLLAPAELVTVIEAQAPLILDIRAPGAPGEVGTYAAGHIAGAISAPYALFRGPDVNPGQVPPEAELTRVLQSLGVTADRPTVIVHQGRDETDFGAAARVYWTLHSSGVGNLAILNGGIVAWSAANQPLDTTPVTPVPSTIEVSFSDRWLATEADVLAVVEGDTEATLIDARPEAFWQGRQFHDAAARPGTLPQSQFFTHSNWFDRGPAIVDAASARALAEQAGYSDEPALISFCNTGHWAATNWFALSELAGIENVRLYPESMVGWSNAGHPMDNVPGPLRRVWMQIVDVF
ncbi:thiosulfate/3-mercaptopyruvate sulfurtransferase [Roseicyclus mahoneyensis]|uniref:Thiosulfate/3-mercaptopyruvate sulfurtransferase n=2 Tax=Roseicyclus mahoneyensis TaxID=164332 RepID=A0A316GI03_9RHOB|nr:thiosulfate/3-mercaptopyruvate sulfurtransferase [Roseicyclus mahoneyensis]